MIVNFYWTVLTLSRQVFFLPCDMYEGWFKLFFERYHSFPPFCDYKWQHLYLPYAWSNTYSWEKLNAIITVKSHQKLLIRILDIIIIIIVIIIPNIYILKPELHRLLKYYGRSWVSKNRILWQVYYLRIYNFTIECVFFFFFFLICANFTGLLQAWISTYLAPMIGSWVCRNIKDLW